MHEIYTFKLPFLAAKTREETGLWGSHYPRTWQYELFFWKYKNGNKKHILYSFRVKKIKSLTYSVKHFNAILKSWKPFGSNAK